MKPPSTPLPGPLGRIPLSALVAVLLLVVTIESIHTVYRDYQNVIEQEFRLLEVGARQREASISGALESVNLLLGTLVEDIDQNPQFTYAEKNRLLKDALRLLPQLRSLLITDASGRITASNNEQLLGFDASVREYFIRHRDAPLDQRFFVSRPFKTVTGVYAITMSRAIVDQKNRFAGTIVATFDGAYFSEALKLRIETAGMEALLIHRNGDILADLPDTHLVGKSLAGGPAYTEHMARHQDSSRHIAMTKLEQVKRLSAFVNLPKAPLTVVLSRNYDAAIAAWRASLVMYLLAFLSLTGVTLLAATLARRRQQALADNERFIRTITDAMPGMVGYWDAELRCHFANKVYLDWFGKPPQEIIGKTMRDLLGEKLFAMNEPYVRAVLKGELQRFERTLTKADQSIGYALAYYIPDVSQDGRVAGFFVLVSDVTPIKLAEQELARQNAALTLEIQQRKVLEEGLRDSQQFVTSILDSLTEHVAVIDADGAITAVNAAWQKFAGENGAASLPQVSVGANYLSVCAQADNSRYGDEAADVLKGIRAVLAGTSEAFSVEYPCHSPTEQRWFVLHGLPLKGQRRGAVLIHRNITERKLAEAELNRYRDHLEERVLARTMELAQARDAAEAANRAKSIFLANMSHELHTPMNGILGMTSLAMRRATDPKQKEQLSIVEQSSKTLLEVLDKILDISRLEAHQLTLVEKDFAVGQAIDAALEKARLPAQAKALHLVSAIDANVPDTLCGDAERLTQILFNFIDNAVKFSEHGEIAVRADAVEQDSHSLLLRIEVRDQGSGISAEQQALLFQAFSQLDGSMTRKHGGNGLGLVIARRLARLMGGDVGVDSEPGNGSTFWATVRLRRPDQTMQATSLPD